MSKIQLLVVAAILVLLAPVAVAESNLRSATFSGDARIFNGEGRIVVALDEDADLLCDRLFLFSPMVPFAKNIDWDVSDALVELEGDYLRLTGEEIWLEVGLERDPFPVHQEAEYVLQITQGVELVQYVPDQSDKQTLNRIVTDQIERLELQHRLRCFGKLLRRLPRRVLRLLQLWLFHRSNLQVYSRVTSSWWSPAGLELSENQAD